MDSLRVTIVGGGAAAVIAARHLLTTTTAPVDLRIIEKDDGIGPGLAYRTTHALHTLNNFAGRLSAVPGDPDHLLRWCARRGETDDPRAFLPRKLYGTYLAETLTDIDVPAGSSLTLSEGRGHRSCCRPTTATRVVTSDGRRIETDVVVLALGNPPPRRRPDLETLRERYVADPWAPGLDERAAEAEAVLLIGTGLTMVDVAASLHDDHPQLTFTAVSRTLLVPAAAPAQHPAPARRLPPRHVLARRARRRGRRPHRRGRRGRWRLARRRRRGARLRQRALAEAVGARPAALRDRAVPTLGHPPPPDGARDGRLHRRDARGRVARARAGGLRRPDDVRPRRQLLRARSGARRPAGTRSSTGCWRAGCSTAHPLGLGLDLDDAGRPRNADGAVLDGVHVLGSARKGLEWEVTAIPDLRAQAVALADHLASPRVNRQAPAGRPGLRGTVVKAGPDLRDDVAGSA